MNKNSKELSQTSNSAVLTATVTSAAVSTTIEKMEKAQSFSSMVFNQFIENKAAVCGAAIILFFVLVAVFAPLIGLILGVDANTQNVFHRYKPPLTRIMASADVKEQQIQTFIKNHPDIALLIQTELIAEKSVQPLRSEDALYDWIHLEKSKALDVLKKIQPEVENKFKFLKQNQNLTSKSASHSETKSSAFSELENKLNHFESFHIFGTDELGRDVLMRLVYGARVSMGVGVLATIVSALIGLIIGSMAGYYGGFMDTVLMRITDSLIALPLLPVLVVVAAIDLQKIPFLQALTQGGNESIIKLVFILCSFSWMTVARLVRGSVLTLREREFILAAKTLGATDSTIILRHMFPNVVAALLVSVTLGVGNVILFEAALSFLGLGIQPPMPSWGNMLFNAQELIYQAPFLAILPGILIFLVVVSFNFLGDGLQDAIDPKAVKR